MTPPDALRRAAQLLDEARLMPDTPARSAKLDEVVSTCGAVIDAIREMRDPINRVVRLERIWR